MSHGRYSSNDEELREIGSRILAVRGKGDFRCGGFGHDPLGRGKL